MFYIIIHVIHHVLLCLTKNPLEMSEKELYFQLYYIDKIHTRYKFKDL